MKKYRAVSLLAAVVAVAGIAVGQQRPDATMRRAANSWLALVDSVRYAQSWDSASAEFKAKVTENQWEAMLLRVRAPLGKAESRALETAAAAKNPPNSPPGEYEILQYATNYSKQPSAAETVALVKDKDGKWRVAGYFIKLPPK